MPTRGDSEGFVSLHSTQPTWSCGSIKSKFALHQIMDDDKWCRITCAALSGEVASDIREVLLQPFRTHKYENLKGILIEHRGLTTPETVNKVISREKMESDIPSRFLRRLPKKAGFGTSGRKSSHSSGFHSQDAYLNTCSLSHPARQCVTRKFARVSG